MLTTYTAFILDQYLRRLHSTEVASELPTQPSRVRILPFHLFIFMSSIPAGVDYLVTGRLQGEPQKSGILYKKLVRVGLKWFLSSSDVQRTDFHGAEISSFKIKFLKE